MVQQLWSEIEKLKAEIRRLRGQMQTISSGGQILPTSIITTGGGSSSSGFLKWKNTTGSTRFTGEIVKEIDTGQEFDLSDLDSVALIGVLAEDTLDNQYGFVRHLGYQDTVFVNGNVTAGNYLSSDAMGGYAYDTGVAVGGAIAAGMFAIALSSFAISSASSLGSVSAYIFPVLR